MLLDEPTVSLDGTAGAVTEELLVQFEKTVHDFDGVHYPDQVKRIADRVIETRDGRFSELA